MADRDIGFSNTECSCFILPVILTKLTFSPFSSSFMYIRSSSPFLLFSLLSYFCRWTTWSSGQSDFPAWIWWKRTCKEHACPLHSHSYHMKLVFCRDEEGSSCKALQPKRICKPYNTEDIPGFSWQTKRFSSLDVWYMCDMFYYPCAQGERGNVIGLAIGTICVCTKKNCYRKLGIWFVPHFFCFLKINSPTTGKTLVDLPAVFYLT